MSGFYVCPNGSFRRGGNLAWNFGFFPDFEYKVISGLQRLGMGGDFGRPLWVARILNPPTDMYAPPACGQAIERVLKRAAALPRVPLLACPAVLFPEKCVLHCWTSQQCCSRKMRSALLDKPAVLFPENALCTAGQASSGTHFKTPSKKALPRTTPPWGRLCEEPRI